MTYRLKFIVGNAFDALDEVPKLSIDCVITSPPYFGLRDYGTNPVIWQPHKTAWGDCKHEFQAEKYYRAGGSTGQKRERFSKAGKENAERVKAARWRTHETCIHCGAERCELGQERYLDDYIDHLDRIFQKVRNVVKSTGVVFLNIGDSYNNASRNSAASPYLLQRSLHLVPQHLAIALQRSGWCIRSEVIWLKTNPAPDPAKTRPGRHHETLWILTKGKSYYWNNEFNDLGSVWPIAVSRNSEHRASMPSALVERCLRLGCPSDGTVLDPFMGSGTTLLAAAKFGLAGVGIDMDAANIQLARNAMGIGRRPIATRCNQLDLTKEGYGVDQAG